MYNKILFTSWIEKNHQISKDFIRKFGPINSVHIYSFNFLIKVIYEFINRIVPFPIFITKARFCVQYF